MWVYYTSLGNACLRKGLEPLSRSCYCFFFLLSRRVIPPVLIGMRQQEERKREKNEGGPWSSPYSLPLPGH